MQSMRRSVDGTARVALISAEADAQRVPEDLEPLLAPGGRISLRDLIDEEVLLALPIVPLHPSQDECLADLAGGASQDEPEAPATQRPFERLGELLKRDR